MSRNREITRQWNVLTDLEASQYGLTRNELADRYGVNDRTIRRDLDALAEIGFPIEETTPTPEGRKRFRLNRRPLRFLNDTGLTLREACALYFSQSAVDHLENTTLARNARSALRKLQKGLPEPIRRFLDRVPHVLRVGPAPRPAGGVGGPRGYVDDLVDAILDRHVVEMRYYSMSSRREKAYVVEPYQVVYGHGALYLCAFVPEYDEVRVFHLDRIRTLSVTARRYTPQPDLITTSVFANSLGAFHGEPEPVDLEFEPAVAPYVTEREWHPSQRVEKFDDGRIRMRLDVCLDAALKTWILGWGSSVRVLSPASLVDEIASEFSRARAMYALPAIGAARALEAPVAWSRADSPAWPEQAEARLTAEERRLQLLLPLLAPMRGSRRRRPARRTG